MKYHSFTGVLFLLVIISTGCSNEDLYPEKTDKIKASFKEGPSSLKMPTVASRGPLFDLATAPNNQILVADASVGITDLSGTLETALPGITSIAAVGRGSSWATTGPIGDATMDNGQGLHQVHKNKADLVVNLFAFEEENDPDGAGVDSNPYSVAAHNASSALVIDSGANDLLRVDNKGNIEVVAIFPDELVSTENLKDIFDCPNLADPCNLPAMIPAQAVPTSIVIGPDGYYYVGELKGFPAPAGESNIWRISPDASGAMCASSPDCLKIFDGGFTSIIDMAFDKNGMLYVAEIDEQSWFAVEMGRGSGGTINACDPETLNCTEVATGIPMLTAITFDKDGKLWATKNALVPGQLEVVEIPL